MHADEMDSLGGHDIKAWASGNQLRYTFWEPALNPWLGLRMDFISGDRDPNELSLQTFNAMFPEGGYFGESGVIGPANLIDIHPAVGLDLGSGVSLTFASVLYWRQSVGDGVYGISGAPFRADAGSRARYRCGKPCSIHWYAG
jgi:hypothetical protein